MMALLSLVIYTRVHNGAKVEPEGVHFVTVFVIEKAESCFSLSRTYRIFLLLKPCGRFTARNEVSR
jgi:hypothetical protein